MLLRAATRRSPLARWQAEHVAARLQAADPAVEVELVEVDTSGDRRLDVPISELGGKGVFAKEVQQAVLDGRADLAVHSAKDLPSTTVPGLVLAAVPERGDPRDALVGSTLAELGPGSRVATGSARRRVQLAELRPGIEFHELRGNMATRLAKAEEFDAIVVAAVAFERLGWRDRVAEVLAVADVVPQVGQGALAVECRADDTGTQQRLSAIEHGPSRRCVDAERAFLAELGGDCELPAGAHAEALDDTAARLRVRGVLAAPDGSAVWRAEVDGDDPEALGRSLAIELRDGPR